MAATGSVQNKLTGSLYGFNVGPFIEFPLHRRVSLTLAGGVGFVYANTTYNFSETVTVPGVVTSVRTGKVSGDDFLFSGLVRGNLYVSLTDALSWELGAAWQYADNSRISTQGKTANLKLDGILSLNTGLN